jgi:hypothetical protein
MQRLLAAQRSPPRSPARPHPEPTDFASTPVTSHQRVDDGPEVATLLVVAAASNAETSGPCCYEGPTTSVTSFTTTNGATDSVGHWCCSNMCAEQCDTT